ncbi:hypothetical protein D3C71_1526080 [compost metagenome]
MTDWPPSQSAVQMSGTGEPKPARYPAGFQPPAVKLSSLLAAAVAIPISAAVIAPLPMFPAIAAAPVVSFTDVSNDRPSRATRGGAHCSAFPRAARQPADDCATGRTNTGALFRLAARRQRQTNEYA